MKIGIISDVHLGDSNCKLIKDGKVTLKYNEFKNTVFRFTKGDSLDYLVLNGDILDFSINSFEESCISAKPFFQALQRDKLTKELIYIPGNHDKHIWDAVEWETNVIRRLKEHKDPRPFRRTQPGYIDYVINTPLVLQGVSRVTGTDHYGTLYLEGLFELNKTLPINIVYPNLYIKTKEDVYLITHGHMLELAWVLLSEILCSEPELVGKKGVRELEEYNIPLTSMICTAVGQAGAVSRLFYKIQREAKVGRTDRLKKLLDNILPKLDNLLELPWYAELLDNALLMAIRQFALSIAGDISDARYDKQFYLKDSIKSRFMRFLVASFSQAEELGIGFPNKIIFGHTHEPRSYNDPMEVAVSVLKDGKLYLYNTGGWLDEKGKSAEIFFFDDNGTLSSINIE
ncbi:MAG: metallophosphoesterase [Thermodesulfovibrionales bacterium]|nr:metallophosphoesterase [Thermodesulfovibrionales bacterium]